MADVPAPALRRVALWGPVVLVMALIYFASALSDPGAPPGGLSDKAAHFIAYGSLGAALIRALAGGRSAGMTSTRVLAATLIATAYGLSDEFHQRFVPGRTADWMDVWADVAGGFAGACALALLARGLSTVQLRSPRPRS